MTKSGVIECNNCLYSIRMSIGRFWNAASTIPWWLNSPRLFCVLLCWSLPPITSLNVMLKFQVFIISAQVGCEATLWWAYWTTTTCKWCWCWGI